MMENLNLRSSFVSGESLILLILGIRKMIDRKNINRTIVFGISDNINAMRYKRITKPFKLQSFASESFGIDDVQRPTHLTGIMKNAKTREPRKPRLVRILTSCKEKVTRLMQVQIFAEHCIGNGYEIAIFNGSGVWLAKDAEDGGEASDWTSEKGREANGYRIEDEGFGACN